MFSKYGWIEPLKDKKVEIGTETFKKLEPQYLWVDKGKELYNKHLKELLEENERKIYLTENEEKSSVCERWNRTIKPKM